MNIPSTFDEFWESVLHCFDGASPAEIAAARLTAQMAWNAACMRLAKTAAECVEWETAQAAREMYS